MSLCLSACAALSTKPIERETIGNENSADVSKRVLRTTDKIINAFDSFLQENRIAKGAIAVSYEGKLVASAGRNRKSTDPARVASLSKAITAVCTMKALENSTYSVKTTLREVIPDELSSFNGSDAFGSITIQKLLNHTSGIRSDHLSRQGPSITRYAQEQKDWQLGNILKHKPSSRDGMTIRYSNANYLILGVVIEKLSNSDYETYCNNEVLAPLGIASAKLSPRWRILSSYGGWEISAVDYLRFVDEYFTNDWKSTFPAARDFHSALQRSNRYGLGVWMRKTFKGMRFWHGGTLRWKSKWENASFGSFFTANENGFSVSVNFSKDTWDGRYEKLTQALNVALSSY